MVIKKYAGFLLVLLVCIGCASAPPATPSPFEGAWEARNYISSGSRSANPSSLTFVGNTMLMVDDGAILGAGEDPNIVGRWEKLEDGAYRMREVEFTFSDTEIKVKVYGPMHNPGEGKDHTFWYTLGAEGLTTEDDYYGKILWVKTADRVILR